MKPVIQAIIEETAVLVALALALGSIFIWAGLIAGRF